MAGRSIALAALAACAVLPAAQALEMDRARNVPLLFQPYTMAKGPEAWRARRAEIKKVLEHDVYGKRPVERPPHLAFSEAEPDAVMMDGRAVRKRVRIEYGGAYGTNSFVATAFVPRGAKGPVPSFLFICTDAHPEGVIDPTRKVKSGDWPAEDIVARGYAAITFWVGDVSPDYRHGNTLGVFAAFEDVKARYRLSERWGSLSAWAWGASRVLDWIETQPSLDAKHVAVAGHSRGGKTALVAAAWDERFAMACSFMSGTGGAKLNHVDLPSSQHIADTLRKRNFWYSEFLTLWANRDMETPFDQHWLVAMIAPRLVVIASAWDDQEAGPYGEYLTAKYASPAWTLPYGKKGFVSDGFPPPDTPQQDGDISYHVRTGGHEDPLDYDWKVSMDFADRHGWRNPF